MIPFLDWTNVFRRLGKFGESVVLIVELGMENGILRGVAGMDVLHESRDVAIQSEYA